MSHDFDRWDDWDFEPMELVESALRIHSEDKSVSALYLSSQFGVYGFVLTVESARKIAENLNKWATIAEATGGS